MKFERPKIVISKCIGFDHCRYDGSMMNSHEADQLKPFVDFMPVCPELEIGLPVPRESLRLLRSKDKTSLVFNVSGDEMTEKMLLAAKKIYDVVSLFQPDGFLLKSRSPSCGIKDVRIYETTGKVPCISKKATGIFSDFMVEHFPEAAFEDEGRISNFSIRENFYTVLFTKADFRRVKSENSITGLIGFHEKNRYLFIAHSPNQFRLLERILAKHENQGLSEIFEAYEKGLMKLLLRKPSSEKYMNVMMNIFSYFSKRLSEKEKAFFIDALEDYHSKHIPQSTVLAILWTWVLRFDEEYLMQQTVFEPYPKDLLHVTDSGKGI